MKTLILFLLLSISIVPQVNSQNSAFLLGINGGANFSSLKYTGYFATQNETTSSKLGFQGGFDLGFKYGNFSFLTGLQYLQAGGNTELRKDDPNDPFFLADGSVDVGVQTTNTSLSMLSIPLLLRYQTKGDLAFAVSLGPIINMSSGTAKTEISYNLTNAGQLGPDEYELSYGDLGNDPLSTGHVGFMFSPGILYKMSDNGVFRFNVTYRSVGDIKNDNFLVADSQGFATIVSGSIKSRALSFEIGYEHRIDFNIGSKY